MSHDKKDNDVTTHDGELPYGLLSRSCFYCPNLITVASLEIKRLVKVMWLWGNDVTTSWGRLPNVTLWMRFTCCPNLILLASSWPEMYRFSNWSFCYFEQFKIDSWIAAFGQVNIGPILHFTDFEQVAVILMSLGKMLGLEKQNHLFVKKFKNHA